MDIVYIFIDDEREPWMPPSRTPNVLFSDIPCITCRNYEAAIDAINDAVAANQDILISFDHDLGEDKTGYDVAKYIVELGYPHIQFHIHSMNPVGRANIQQLLTHYGYTELI